MSFIDRNCIYSILLPTHIYNDAHNALDGHQNDGSWTLLRGGSSPVADSVLSLKGEQKAGGEALDVVHTVHMVIVLSLVQITVTKHKDLKNLFPLWICCIPEGEKIPDYSKPRPGHVK